MTTQTNDPRASRRAIGIITKALLGASLLTVLAVHFRGGTSKQGFVG